MNKYYCHTDSDARDEMTCCSHFTTFFLFDNIFQDIVQAMMTQKKSKAIPSLSSNLTVFQLHWSARKSTVNNNCLPCHIPSAALLC